MKRFNYDADNILEARNYISNRAIQMLRLGYRLLFMQTHNWGLDCYFIKDKKVYQAIYILKSYRGKGLYPTLVKQTIVTSWDCKINEYLQDKGIDHVTEDLIPYDEYTLMAQIYGDDKAKRSGVYYMNHVDEGLAVLEWIGASDEAKRSYIAHPIYQGDIDLANNYNRYGLDCDVMLLIMEYRSVANEYLSHRKITSLDEIRLSPLKEVNDMLIADKVQNRKDFELYHYGKHPRSKELMEYFINWLTKLGISEDQYQEFKNKLG